MLFLYNVISVILSVSCAATVDGSFNVVTSMYSGGIFYTTD